MDGRLVGCLNGLGKRMNNSTEFALDTIKDCCSFDRKVIGIRGASIE